MRGRKVAQAGRCEIIGAGWAAARPFTPVNDRGRLIPFGSLLTGWLSAPAGNYPAVEAPPVIRCNGAFVVALGPRVPSKCGAFVPPVQLSALECPGLKGQQTLKVEPCLAGVCFGRRTIRAHRDGAPRWHRAAQAPIGASWAELAVPEHVRE